MALLEAKAQRLAAEEEAKRQLSAAGGALRLAPKGGNISFVRGESTQNQSSTIQAENPDEIDIDDDEDEDEDGDAEGTGRKKGKTNFLSYQITSIDILPISDMTVETQTVPSAVFGSLAKDDDDDRE